MHNLWGFLGGAGQGQPPPVFCLGPPCLSWLLFMLGLEIPRRSLSVNLGWLLLVPGLGLTEATEDLGSCET